MAVFFNIAIVFLLSLYAIRLAPMGQFDFYSSYVMNAILPGKSKNVA